jgi:uncharacterized metal-binding protein
MPKWVWFPIAGAFVASAFSYYTFMLTIIMISMLIEIAMMLVFGAAVGAVIKRLGRPSFSFTGKNGVYSFVIGAAILTGICYLIFGSGLSTGISDLVFWLHGPIV